MTPRWLCKRSTWKRGFRSTYALTFRSPNTKQFSAWQYFLGYFSRLCFIRSQFAEDWFIKSCRMLVPKLVFKFKHQLLPAYTSWGRDFLDDLVFPICKARVTRRISTMELRVLNILKLGNSLQQCQKSWIKLFLITVIFKSPLHGKTSFHHDGKYPRYLKYKAKALQFAQWIFFL